MFKKLSPTSLGMWYVVLSMMCFAVANGLIKSVGDSYFIVEIVFFRFFLATFVNAGNILYLEGVKGFAPKYMSYQIIRALMSGIGLGCIFYSFTAMCLCDAIAISFGSVFFAIIYAIYLLKEKIDITNLVYVITGFLGVAMVANPTGDFGHYQAVLILLLGTAIDGGVLTTGRHLALKGVSPASISFYISLVITIGASIIMLLGNLGVLPEAWAFKWPESGSHAFRLAMIGIMGGFGQYYVTKGFAMAPSANAGPMMYTIMIWSIVIGYFFWAETPTMWSILGAVVITLSGIMIAVHAGKKEKSASKNSARSKNGV